MPLDASRPGTTWYMLDPLTGNLILTLKNVPAGTATTDQDGSLLRYSYNVNTGKLTLLELNPSYLSQGDRQELPIRFFILHWER